MAAGAVRSRFIEEVASGLVLGGRVGMGVPGWTDGEGDEQPVHGGPVERLPGLASL